MSTAAPRSCLKPPVRNPWVAEDGGESSTSSSQHQQQQQQQQHSTHTDSQDVLAHQYATPFHAPPPSTHQAAHTYTVTAAHTVVSGNRPTHGVPSHSAHTQLTTHSSHGVVHSHTAHSLYSTAHSVPATAHSVHSVPGTMQQPWVDPQLLWSTPTLPGVGCVPGGVYTVGTGPEGGSCPGIPPPMYTQQPPPHAHLHPLHHVHPGAGGGAVWGSSGRGAGEGRSRCERCHYYCFRAAQVLFVLGIVTGFSLLVAGGVFHRQHVAHLQVLVYIGAMVSLVCVVLLVIFCAMNKDHRTRRSVLLRYPGGPPVVSGDPESVPLRPMDPNNPVLVPGDLGTHGVRPGESASSRELLHQSNHSSCMVTPANHSAYMTAANHSGGCLVGTTNHNVCFVAPAAHSVASVISSSNQRPHGMTSVASSEIPPHLSRHPPQRVDDDQELNRYNRIWKQPGKGTSEAASKL